MSSNNLLVSFVADLKLTSILCGAVAEINIIVVWLNELVYREQDILIQVNLILWKLSLDIGNVVLNFLKEFFYLSVVFFPSFSNFTFPYLQLAIQIHFLCGLRILLILYWLALLPLALPLRIYFYIVRSIHIGCLQIFVFFDRVIENLNYHVISQTFLNRHHSCQWFKSLCISFLWLLLLSGSIAFAVLFLISVFTSLGPPILHLASAIRKAWVQGLDKIGNFHMSLPRPHASSKLAFLKELFHIKLLIANNWNKLVDHISLQGL